MIDGKNIGAAGFKYLGTSYSTMDCQAFVERCLADSGWKIDLAGSNAWYRKCVTEGWVGTPEEAVKLFGKTPVGAFLFIHANDGKEPAKYHGDGLGNASHIGIVTGTGEGAIHSSASRGCVAESKYKGKSINGGWNKVGLLPGDVYYAEIDTDPSGDGGGKPAGDDPEPEPVPALELFVYAENGKPVNLRKEPSTAAALVDRVPVGDAVDVLSDNGEWARVDWHGKSGYMMSCFLVESMPASDGLPTLQKGDRGEYVTLLQTKLIQRGYSCGSTGADGIFGKDTYYAVSKFQLDHGLMMDGIAGPATWEALDDSADGIQVFTVHIPFLPKYKAEALISQYSGAWMTEGSDDK